MTASTESAVPTDASQLRIPDFFIVGHAKCGTTALCEMLRRHPQIYIPALKEPWYFSRDNPQPETGSERSVTATGNRPMGLDEYLSLFAAARDDQRIGEGSTSYLWSTTAARAIVDLQPGARIIAIFREPASFLHSLHLQLLSNHTESERDFRKAVALDEARREGREIPRYAFWPQALIYSDRVRYVEQLRRYHDVFPPEQVLVLIYDDFRGDNEGTLRRVFRFLDVDDTHPIDVMEVGPTTRRVRSSRINDIARVLNQGRGPVSGAVNSTIKAITTRGIRSTMLRPVYRRLLYGRPRPADAGFMCELRRRFKPEVVALSEYLDRDLITLWGYDSLI
jgi:Sulfotransferase family